MAGHSAACQGSTALCENLLEELRRRIPNVERTSGRQWCSVFRVGKKRLAYITHFKTDEKIQIWCRGEPADLLSETAIDYHERQPTDSGWGKTFKGRFDV